MKSEAKSENCFFCVACGARLAFPSNPANHVVECPSCSRFVQVPGHAEHPPVSLPAEVIALEVKFLCGSCGTKLRGDARWEGLSVKCPVCRAKVTVPQWSGQAAKNPPANRDTGRAATATLSMAEVEFLAEPDADPTRVAC